MGVRACAAVCAPAVGGCRAHTHAAQVSKCSCPTHSLTGAYPASLDDAETDRILTTLLELGGCWRHWSRPAVALLEHASTCTLATPTGQAPDNVPSPSRPNPAGVNTFVCLQAEFSLHTPEGSWRSGQGLRPYIKDAQRLLIRAREEGSHRIKQERCRPLGAGRLCSSVPAS